jgi:Zn-dependent oligopeptidase
LDFVEMPSTLFEHFAGDYRVVREFSQPHDAAGNVLSEDEFLQMKRQNLIFPVLDAQHQVGLAIFDLVRKNFREGHACRFCHSYPILVVAF